MSTSNRVGSLAAVARVLTHADINIAYAYCTATDHQQLGCLVIKSDEMDRALELLTQLDRNT